MFAQLTIMLNNIDNYMAKKETDKELLILACAEEEFLSKGYVNTKTTEIAKHAGVTHAMLHYYYRTKENLFEIILEKKVELLTGMFLFSLRREDLAFTDKLKKGIEDHFDFVAANPKLPNFIFSEIISNELRKKQFLKLLKPKAIEIIEDLKKNLKEEELKGKVKYIEPQDLLYTIISLNVFSILASPVIKGIMDISEKQYSEFKEHRKKQNVEFIMSMLRV